MILPEADLETCKKVAPQNLSDACAIALLTRMNDAGRRRQEAAERRSTRPGTAPVWSPPSITTSPLTTTVETPTA